jgi:hypothetical protein
MFNFGRSITREITLMKTAEEAAKHLFEKEIKMTNKRDRIIEAINRAFSVHHLGYVVDMRGTQFKGMQDVVADSILAALDEEEKPEPKPEWEQRFDEEFELEPKDGCIQDFIRSEFKKMGGEIRDALVGVIYTNNSHGLYQYGYDYLKAITEALKRRGVL